MLEKAKQFATKAHEGQVRKSTGLPMITHPIRVAETLQNAGFSDEVVAAGYLHDTVEDTSVTLDDIEREFGFAVRVIVAGNTENKDDSWEARKQHTIDSIKAASRDIKALVVADKLDNLNALIDDYQKEGENIWAHFKRGRNEQKWYFTSVAKNAFINLSEEDVPAFLHEYNRKALHFFA